MWACLFFSLLSLNIGFVLGCFFSGLKSTPQEKKQTAVNVTTKKPSITQKEKNYRDDIKFLMNFDGNKKKDEEL